MRLTKPITSRALPTGIRQAPACVASSKLRREESAPACVLATLLCTAMLSACQGASDGDAGESDGTESGTTTEGNDAGTGTDTGTDTTGGELEYPFPEDFYWGTATAGFQVEMGCPTLSDADCLDTTSDWYQWVTDPEIAAASNTFISGDPIDWSPGMWETYDQDFARASDELHGNMVRISLEWSRLFPLGDAEMATNVDELAALADPDAVAGYHAMLASARAHGLEPVVTLHHYTIPLWLHDGKACKFAFSTCIDRGWADPDRMLPAIELYAAWAASEYGDQVDWWATINEPFVISLAGYLLPSEARTNPPGQLLQLDTAIEVYFSLAEGHVRMYDAIHEYDDQDASGDGVYARVGPVPNLAAMAPDDPTSAADIAVVGHADHLYNKIYLDAVIYGELDRNLDGVTDEMQPSWAEHADYIGVNYYSRIPVRAQPTPLFPDYPWFDFLPQLDDIWQPYPAGLTEVLVATKEYGKPILITENGTPHVEDANVAQEVLEPHIIALHDAITAGVDVRGYLVWSLIDNFEWNHGMQLRFGMYALDVRSKERTLRPIGARYAEIAQANGL